MKREIILLIFLTLFLIGCSSECPQLNYPIQHDEKLSIYSIQIENHDGWSSGGLPIICYNGIMEGQRPDYWYCGGFVGYKSYVYKTFINSDGTIGKTIKKSIMNVYNANQTFIKTICE